MNQKRPDLTICIPTFNRCRQLEKSVQSLVCQECFHEIEVVISDNCSTDNTKALCCRFAKRYSNIKYYRNESNIGMANLPLSLRLGHGSLRKLSNDTLIYEPGALAYMLSAVRKYQKTGKLLYFLNGAKMYEKKTDKNSDIECRSADSFFRNVSYRITWIASVAVWAEDCGKDCGSMMIYESEEATAVAQVAYLADIFQKRKSAVILNRKIMCTQPAAKKDLSYGLFDVFYSNFLGMLHGYAESGMIEWETYEAVRRDLLIDFFPGWVVRFETDRNMYHTSDENLAELIENAYKNKEYYRVYKRKVKMMKMYLSLRKFLDHVTGR